MNLRKNRWTFFPLALILSPLYAQVTISLSTGTPEEIVASIDEVVAKKIKDKAVVAELVQALGKEEMDVRVKERSAWALGQLKIESAVKPLSEAAKHKSLLIRSAALNSLIRLRSSAALPIYIEIAKNDPILSLRERATIALGLLRSEKAIETLVKLSSDLREEVRGAAVLAMAATHSKKNNFSEIVKEMTADPSPYVQERAKKALEIIQGKNSGVYPQLSTDDSDVRLIAALFFHSHGKTSDLKTLKDAQTSEADDEVREELESAIKAIEKRAAQQKSPTAEPITKKKKTSSPKPSAKN